VAPTIVQVSATYSGASPSVIADTVATPIEDQINSVENVYFFDSRCNDSGSYELFVTFLPGTNPDMNLVKVQNAVKRAEPKLPSEVLQVGLTIGKCSSDYAIQFVFMTDGTEMDHVELGNFVNHEIKDALQRVRGIASVSCSNNEYAMRIWLDTLKMDALGISVADVRSAISGQNIQPAAGFVGNAMSSQYLSYKVNAPGRLASSSEFESIVVRCDSRTGARVLLGILPAANLARRAIPRSHGSAGGCVIWQAPMPTRNRIRAKWPRPAAKPWKNG
jgi:HAE1 family hydrophobic/amphiphilic exporter-1